MQSVLGESCVILYIKNRGVPAHGLSLAICHMACMCCQHPIKAFADFFIRTFPYLSCRSPSFAFSIRLLRGAAQLVGGACGRPRLARWGQKGCHLGLAHGYTRNQSHSPCSTPWRCVAVNPLTLGPSARWPTRTIVGAGVCWLRAGRKSPTNFLLNTFLRLQSEQDCTELEVSKHRVEKREVAAGSATLRWPLLP